MFDFDMPNLFGEDNKTLLWVGLGLMVAAIAIYVFMTRKVDSSPIMSQQAPPTQWENAPVDTQEVHPTELDPTQMTCFTNESGEQTCSA
jgi:hypothetical protein